MAYLRYDRHSEWYVFEHTSGKLAVWHQDFRSQDPQYTESEVRAFLEAGVPQGIVGCTEANRPQLVAALEKWLSDLARDEI